MATRNYVPRANGEGSIGTAKKHWGSAFFDKVAVKAIEVIGGGSESDGQPATVGWVKQNLTRLLKSALEATGMRINVGSRDGGYICFGALFGGLIVQWGEENFTHNKNYTDVVYPVAFKQSSVVIPIDEFYANLPLQNEVGFFVIDHDNSNNEKFRLCSYTTEIGAFKYLAIGF